LYPGMLPGHTLGINERGLVQTINNIQPFDLKPGVPRHVIARAVLNCEHLDDALELLNRNDRASGFHHSLMQAGDQRLLSVEAPASGCDAQNILKAYVHTNHLIRPPLSNIPATISPSSKTRFVRAHELIDQDLKTKLLFDRNPGSLSLYRTADDKNFDDEFTLATGVFTITDTGVNWKIMTAPDDPSALRSAILV